MASGCQILDQKLLKEHNYTRISCFIIYLCVCFPSQHQQYAFSIFWLWCVCQFFFNTQYDLAMSNTQLQWQWKHFGERTIFLLIRNGIESWGLCCLTERKRVTYPLHFMGLLQKPYELKTKRTISDGCWYAPFSHFYFIVLQLIKATLGSLWPLGQKNSHQPLALIYSHFIKFLWAPC